MNAFQCQVHGRDLGRAIAAFNAAGIVVDQEASYRDANGMYTLIVYAPAGIDAAGLDFRQLEQRNRQRSRRWRTIRKALLIVAILAAVAAVVYFGFAFFSAMFGGGVSEAAAPALPDPLAPLRQATEAAVTAFQAFVGLCVLVVLFMARGIIAPALRGFADGIGSVVGMLRKGK